MRGVEHSSARLLAALVNLMGRAPKIHGALSIEKREKESESKRERERERESTERFLAFGVARVARSLELRFYIRFFLFSDIWKYDN